MHNFAVTAERHQKICCHYVPDNNSDLVGIELLVPAYRDHDLGILGGINTEQLSMKNWLYSPSLAADHN